LPAATPVAIVQHAGLPGRRSAITSLAGLMHRLRRHGLGSPSVIVIGDVVEGVDPQRCWPVFSLGAALQ
jgi:uroporphyrin-III C-methyltransferase